MLRYCILLAALVAIALGEADHDTFKDCSRIEFCTALRKNVIDSSAQFFADLGELEETDEKVTIPLSNENGDSLILQISLLPFSRARIQVLQPGNDRYELVDVLDGEPETIPFSSVNLANNTLTLIPEGEEYSIVVNRGAPFTVEFYLERELQTIFDGSRLLMENTEDSQAFTFGVSFNDAQRLYGLYHHASKLGLRETGDDYDPFRLRNLDVSFYELDSPMALYGSVPVLYGHSVSHTSGIFIHNAAEQWVDINYGEDSASTYFMIGGGSLDIFVLFGPEPKDVVRQYTSLTGTAHLPQIWTLGYHQCRFTYETQEEVKEVVALFDVHDIPLDVIWLDDGHSNANRYFEFNPENFTNPEEMFNNISSTGRRAVSISDPHIKIADDYNVYTGAKNKYFVKWENGSDFEGICWPGLSSWIDFLNPEASEYYSGWYAFDKFNGSTETLAGIWNDMNEPSVFDNSLEKTFPHELLHYGNVRHRDVHGIYGMLQTKATYHGLMKRDEGKKRPFILTRSHFAGSQRYAAMWTGDNTAGWGYLAISFSECMTSNILGIVFCGADIGGFFDTPDDELLQRWYQGAVWLPFFRGHSNKGTPRREPYVFSEDVQTVISNAIKLRYKHIPVLYTLFYEHATTGDPIIRPLFYEYHELLDYDNHLLAGTDILAVGVFESNATSVEVTFPGKASALWYRIDDESWESHNGEEVVPIPVTIDTSPVFYRGGSIISRKDIKRPSTTQMVDDPYTLYINLDSEQSASGRLYVDDYTSFAYREEELFLYIRFIYVLDVHAVQIEYLGGNAAEFSILVRSIIVNGRSPEGRIISNTYTTTRDGLPLESINIGKLIVYTSERNFKKVFGKKEICWVA
ncbi:hypothetical protein NQ318_016200 [Aromia moschata]|uniref:Glucosidase II subunit alpha n=1 Tax=Aromia moschata TaxID=1265417 RepID=A0AAV8YGD7_9CUCU|nr:hypothetical protein NQ318_016200 [Aromia moschata]